MSHHVHRNTSKTNLDTDTKLTWQFTEAEWCQICLNNKYITYFTFFLNLYNFIKDI